MKIQLTLAALFLTAALHAAPVIFSRPLPTTGLNGPGTSAFRSNGSIIQTGTIMFGDDFSFSGSAYLIDTITVYVVGNSPTSGPITTPDTEFSAVKLHLGDNLILTTVIPTYSSFLRVKYNGTTDYEDLDIPGVFYPVYALTYAGLNFVALPDTIYDFALEGVAIGGNTTALHVTNDPVAVADPLSSSNGVVQGYKISDKSFDDFYTVSNFGAGTNPVDANILITGTAIPEPSTFGLIGIGIGVLALRLRRRK